MPDQVSELGSAAVHWRRRIVSVWWISCSNPSTNRWPRNWIPHGETEIERRLAENDQGTVRAVNAAEVFDKARRIAEWSRSASSS